MKIKNSINLSIILCVVIFLFFNSSCKEEQSKMGVIQHTVNFRNTQSNLYFIARTWGLGGNHEEIILSPTLGKRKADFEIDDVYIFYASEIYYKKDENRNELIIYANKNNSLQPKKFISEVTVIIKDLKTSDELNSYRKRYMEYGLNKISVFEKDNKKN